QPLTFRRQRRQGKAAASASINRALQAKQSTQECAVHVGAMAQVDPQRGYLTGQGLLSPAAQRQAVEHCRFAVDLERQHLLILVGPESSLECSHGITCPGRAAKSQTVWRPVSYCAGKPVVKGKCRSRAVRSEAARRYRRRTASLGSLPRWPR